MLYYTCKRVKHLIKQEGKFLIIKILGYGLPESMQIKSKTSAKDLSFEYFNHIQSFSVKDYVETFFRKACCNSEKP